VTLEPMKVVHLIDSLGAGGAEKSLAELLPGLRDAGVESLVACLDRRVEGFEGEVVAAGFSVRIVGRGPRGLRAVRRLLRDESPSLLHTTLVRADIVGRLAAIGAGVPVLTSLVNTPYDAERLLDPTIRRSRLAAWRVVDGVTARRLTTHFHSISHAVARSYERHLHIDPRRITVIGRGRDERRLGVPSPERRRAVRRALGIGDDVPVVVNVGRQERQKAHSVLLEAVPALVARVPGVVVLVAGRAGNASADLAPLLEQEAIASHVRFLGHREDVPDLLAAADLFVFPSIFEGLGGAVIEAMALGLPIVATDLPALREVASDDNATFVPSGSPTVLAEAMADVLLDPVRAAAQGARSRARFVEHHSLARTTQQMADLYRTVVAGGRR
jgi:glycosyltransferase involved in cell wall biosynthesis